MTITIFEMFVTIRQAVNDIFIKTMILKLLECQPVPVEGSA